MPLPGGTEYDWFAKALQEAREAIKRPRGYGGGRPPLDPRKGKQYTLYFRADVMDYLQEKVILGEAANLSQAANQAIRRTISEEAKKQ